MSRPPKQPDFQDAILAKLKKVAPRDDEFGTWEVSRSNTEVLSKIKYVITTGISSFDDVVGGMPVGRIAEIFGTEGCGKTALALRTAARAQLGHISEVVRQPDGSIVYRPLEPEEFEVAVLYIDNEQSIDDGEKIVFEGKELDINIARCDTADMIFKMSEAVIDVAEERADADNKLHFVVIVVDTIASTSTVKELNAKWGSVDFPRLPAELSKGFSRLVRRINRNNVCMICTNQVRTDYQSVNPAKGRSNIPQSFEYKSLGGMALKFYASHRLFMYQQPGKYKLRPDAQFSAGLVCGFHTVKNRLKMPQRDGRMVLLYDKAQGGYHEPFSLLENLILLGFVEVGTKKGTDYTLKFHKHGIIPVTFDAAKLETSLEEDDIKPGPKRGSSRKDPGFRFRAEWPAFYAEHKLDVDALWKAAVDYTFSTPGLSGASGEEETISDSELSDTDD